MNFKPNKLNVIVGVILFILTAVFFAAITICTDISQTQCFFSVLSNLMLLGISLVVGIVGYVIASLFLKK